MIRQNIIIWPEKEPEKPAEAAGEEAGAPAAKPKKRACALKSAKPEGSDKP